MKKILSLFMVLLAFCACSLFETTNNNLVSTKAEAATYNKVQAAHILVPTEKEAIKIREEIMTESNSGKIFDNFMTAAKKYSKCPSGSAGGILGWFGRGDMVKPFETAAFNLPVNEVSEPVKTQFGWHLIYVISKK